LKLHSQVAFASIYRDILKHWSEPEVRGSVIAFMPHNECRMAAPNNAFTASHD